MPNWGRLISPFLLARPARPPQADTYRADHEQPDQPPGGHLARFEDRRHDQSDSLQPRSRLERSTDAPMPGRNLLCSAERAALLLTVAAPESSNPQRDP